jgi:hypothetical protein
MNNNRAKQIIGITGAVIPTIIMTIAFGIKGLIAAAITMGITLYFIYKFRKNKKP